MAWTVDQLERLARLADEFVGLPEADRGPWVVHARLQNVDLATAITAMAQADCCTSFPAAPALNGPLDLDDTLPQAGDTIGPYRLHSPLGQGGMSTVWLADQIDGRVRRRVALKVLAPQLSSAAWALQFERERDILASLSHPGIARLIDAGRTEHGHAFLVMDLIDGENIIQYATRLALQPRASIALVMALLKAVAYAHEMSVIHRDIKPSNVMVDRRGHVMLLDFGIATALQSGITDDASAQAPLNALDGQALTLDYAPPEQVAGLPVGRAADVYAIGVLLYELVAGQRPYRLLQRNRAAVAEAIFEQGCCPPSQRVDPAWAQHLGMSQEALAQQLKGPLDAIILKALQADPEQRYPNANAFADALGRWLAAQEPAARPRPGHPIQDQIRAHLMHAITVIGLGVALVAFSDLFAPSWLPVATAIGSVSVGFAGGLMLAACRHRADARRPTRCALLAPSASSAQASTGWRRLLHRVLALSAMLVSMSLTATWVMAMAR